jgi:apolipoprotein N-acyltransferase
MAGYLFWKIRTGKFFDIFILSFLWVLMEYSRTLLSSFIYNGAESIFGPHQTIGFVGYSLASSYNLLQLAKFGGVYFSSFVLIFINGLIYWVFFKSSNGKKKSRLAILVVLFFSVLFPLNIFSKDSTSDEEGTKVSVLQTKNESFFRTNDEEIKRKNQTYERLFLQTEEENPDSEIIIFPEDTRFSQTLLNERRLVNYYFDKLKNKDKLIVDSSRIRDENNKTKLRLYYYNAGQKSMEKYDKNLLTPGGEYLPTSFMSVAKSIGFGNWAKKTNDGKYTKGEKIEIGHYKNKGIGGLFCFEIISPEISREMTRLGAEVFINPASHGSFRGDKILYNQIINITKVRAVENGRYFIQAGNYIPSTIISDKGEVIYTSQVGEGVLHGEVFLKNKKTFYIRFGNWFVYLSFLVLAIFSLKKGFVKNNK